MSKNTLRRITLSSLFSATFLAACGGGGDQDTPPPAPSPLPASSEACFNAGFYRTGTQINYTQTSTQQTVGSINAPTYVRSIVHHVVGEVQENGVNTILVEPPGMAYGSTRYSIENGALLYHGYGNLDSHLYSSKESLTPARKFVIAMKEGETTTQNIVQNREGWLKGIHTYGDNNVNYTRTYVGQETITTPLGQFLACRFFTTTVRQDENSGISKPDFETQATSWVAAAGPYRGLTLREESSTLSRYMGTDVNHIVETTSTEINETTQVTLFDIK